MPSTCTEIGTLAGRCFRNVRRPRRRAIAALLALNLVIVVAAVAALRRPAFLTTMTADVEGYVTTHEAHVGAVYDIGVWLYTHGTGHVRLVSSHMSHGSEITELAPMVGTRCTHRGGIVYGGIGDLRHFPEADVRLASATSFRSSPRDPCWYAVLRFVPNRLGTLKVGGGELVYRVGGVTKRARLIEFEYTMIVNATGKDPRDIY